MLRIAKKLAAKSTHRQHHHAVIITKGGAILSMATNKNFKHAEVLAIRQLWGDWKRGNLTLWSFRWQKSGQWGNAKPCPDCEDMIKAMGIRKVYFTNEKGELTKLCV